MARNTIQSSDYNFTVERVPLLLPNGDRSRVFSHVRTDNGDELGWGTDQYGFVQNSDLIDSVQDAFKQRKLTPTNERVVVTGRGERMYAQYDFTNKTVSVNRKDRKVGDELGLRLTVQNSFDRSLRVSFALGMVRLVCTNGMTTMEKEFSMTKKHSSNVEIGFIGNALDRAKGSFAQAAKGFSLLGEREITQDQGRNILNQLNKSKVLSNVVRDGILKVWDNPTYEEDEARNLWTLYNAATQHLTHDVSDSRFEYANSVSSNVLKRLRGAVESSDKFGRLVTAVPVDVIKN